MSKRRYSVCRRLRCMALRHAYPAALAQLAMVAGAYRALPEPDRAALPDGLRSVLDRSADVLQEVPDDSVGFFWLWMSAGACATLDYDSPAGRALLAWEDSPARSGSTSDWPGWEDIVGPRPANVP